MSQRHTPGPWMARPSTFFGTTTPSRGAWRVEGPDGLVGLRREEDARLIAAAPELLEAARRFQHWYEYGDGRPPLELALGELSRRFAEAIAKASG